VTKTVAPASGRNGVSVAPASGRNGVSVAPASAPNVTKNWLESNQFFFTSVPLCSVLGLGGVARCELR
jgi:hypothetical protein